MESFVNISDGNQSSSQFSNDTLPDVSLFATYLKIILLLMVIPAVIISAGLVIHVIRKVDELHTRHCFFIINLLVCDILTNIRYIFEICVMILYLLDVKVDISIIFYVIISVPQLAISYLFILLAFDRIIAVSSSYCYKSIITIKVAYVLVIFTWLVAGGVSFSIPAIEKLLFVQPLGIYIAENDNPFLTIIALFPQGVSILIIIVAGVYLYYNIVQSSDILDSDLMVSGGNTDEERIKLRESLHTFRWLRKQIKPTISTVILGGIDGIINILQSIILGITKDYHPMSSITYLYTLTFVVYPLDWCQLISHSLVYGIYMKRIRNRLCKRRYYLRLRQLFPLQRSHVRTISPHA